MFEDLKIHIDCFFTRPQLNSKTALGMGERGRVCFALVFFLSICMYSVSGSQLVASWLCSERLSTLDGSHGTRTQGG